MWRCSNYRIDGSELVKDLQFRLNSHNIAIVYLVLGLEVASLSRCCARQVCLVAGKHLVAGHFLLELLDLAVEVGQLLALVLARAILHHAQLRLVDKLRADRCNPLTLRILHVPVAHAQLQRMVFFGGLLGLRKPSVAEMVRTATQRRLFEVGKTSDRWKAFYAWRGAVFFLFLFKRVTIYFLKEYF